MPSSTISLDSLSSPSPSPSPPPPDTHTSASNQSGGGAGLDSGSELSELTEDEQENEKGKATREERPRPQRRGRKRGGIVPAPMWDWAYKNNKKELSRPKPEEEEEEEQAGPAKAMEEEEDDEQDEHSHTGASPVPDRRGKRAAVKGALLDDDEEVDTGHTTPSVIPMRDAHSNEPDLLSEDDDGEHAADAEDDGTRHTEDGGAASQDATDDENADEEDGDAPVEDEHQEDDDDADENAAVESEDDADEPPSVAVSTPAVVSAASRPAIEPSTEPETGPASMDVDQATPGAAQRSPIIAAAIASSIMAGSSVIRAPSPTPSASSAEGSTRKRTPADSRSPTPEVPSDREKRAPVRTRTRARNGRSTRNRNRRKAKTEPVIEPVADDQGQADDHDVEGDDVDVDNGEMEMESDLQPAHRAEALDVLATIELKYALLRERLYVEKMENLAWEEALVLEGAHPEMLHLHTELSKRRDKRLELAARRRDYEVVNLTKRRRLDEDAVWSWWQYRRDELQTTMIAETNRKRRKLDRERRALDRPPPVRRIPSPPSDVPVAPTLRELVKSNPFDSPESRRRQLPLSSLAYPQLSTLSSTDIINDLEFLNGHRRAYDSARSGMMGMNAGVGHPAGAPPGFEQFNMGLGMMDGPGMPNRLPPHMPFQHAPLPQPPMPNQMMPGYPTLGPAPAPRLQHHHSAPPGNVPNMAHSQMLIEQDVGPIGRPGSGAPRANQFPGQSVPLMRRSISPVPLQSYNASSSGASLLGNKSNGWVGLPGPVNAPLPGSSKSPMRLGGNIRPVEAEVFDREKERERLPDALKARERTEWEWEREREREREREFERERDREKDRDRDHDREQDRDMEGANQTPQLLQRHQHPLLAPPLTTNPLLHHHHRHHHHVHHHHPLPQSPNASSPTILPPQALNGTRAGITSPLLSREFEARRVQGDAPMEGVELSAPNKSTLSSPISTFRKGSDELLASPADFARDRGRAALIAQPQERITTPFVMTPSQATVAMQDSFSPSSRNLPGPSTAPASIAPSRRGSWSPPAEGNVPRPSSSASSHVGNSSSSTMSHLHPSAGLTSKRFPLSPSMQPPGSPLTMSPSHNNGIRLPPLTPPTGSRHLSPVRNPRSLPPLSSAPASTSQPKPTSPKMIRRGSPPPVRSKSPGRGQRDQPNDSDNGTVSAASTTKPRPLSPVPIFAVSSSIPAPLSGPRLPSVNPGSDGNLPPVPQSVPS